MGNPAVFDVETVGQGGIAIERRQTGIGQGQDVGQGAVFQGLGGGAGHGSGHIRHAVVDYAAFGVGGVAVEVARRVSMQPP